MRRFLPAWRKVSGLGGLVGVILSEDFAQAAAPVVAKVRAAQRAGTELADVYYKVAARVPPLTVAVQVSANGGASYAVLAAAFTGDFGSVPAGRGRRVTWNAAADFNGTYSPAMRFKVTATDAPAGMVLIPAGSFQIGNWPTVVR